MRPLWIRTPLGKRLVNLLVVLVLAGAGYAWQALRVPDAAPARVAAASTPSAHARIARAFDQKQSGFMVEVDGSVARELADDRRGSRHQRFILELPDGRTLLVAHNIDLAPRVPLRPGAVLRVKGQYEWNAQGGLLHWTHHDPDGRHEGGWIRMSGRTYE